MSLNEPAKRISSTWAVKTATYMTKNGLIATCLFGLLIGGSDRAHGVDPSRHISQYSHTAWRVRDGYFQAPPLAVAQTKDGQLWLGGEGGLLHFDGVQFSSWKPPEGQALPSERIYGLLGSSDGSLWIGTGRGLAQWKNDKLTVYSKLGRFSSLIEDHRGTIWAGHTRAIGILPPLCRFADNDFKCFEFASEPGMSWVGALKEDRNGDLWIATAGAVCRRERTGKTDCYLIPNFNPAETARGIQCMAIDSDGSVWLDGGVTGIWQLKSGRWKRYREFPQLKLELTSALLDREGGLWLGDRNHGLLRHIEGRTEQFDPTDGLSSETVTAIFEDREGSVWTATNAGLDRFRDVKVATIAPREGLPVPAVGSVQASRDGGLWIAGLTQLVRSKIGGLGVYTPVDGLPESGDLGAIFEDSREHLWLGVGQTLAWRENGQFHKVSSLRLHQVGQRVQAISEDAKGNIWVGTTDPDFALLRIHDGRVLEKFTRRQLGGQVSAMAADLTEGMWISRGEVPGLILALNGTLAAQVDEFPESVRNMFSDSHGLWASTKKGVFAYANGIVKKLTTQNGLSCDNLDAAIKDDSGALWLRGTCGLMQVPASELELWWKDPSRRVQVKHLDAFDGSQAGTSSFVHITKTSDGRIWFALEEVGVQVVDPKRLQDNPAAPPVAVTRLVADRRSYPLSTKLRLPALTRDLEIDYTAYSLAIPEKVRFRYRLEGVDKKWQDVETRRQAYFTNLRPGSYRFAVSAANNDGVWNEQGAILDFSIAPAWFQTIWFRALSVVAFFGLLWSLYWMRLRQVQRQFNISLEARLNERTRIINTIPALAWSARPDGAAEFFNQRWLDYTGLSAEQSRGRGWMAAIHPDEVKAVADYWQSSLLSGKAAEVEARVSRRDGAYRWFLFRTDPLRDESGKVIKWYGTITDIEDHRRLEETLRANELSLRQIVDNIPGFVHTTSAMGEVEFLSRQTLDYFGKTKQELNDWSQLGIVHPEDLPRVIEAFRSSIETGQNYEIEQRCRRADGVYRWFQVRAQAVRNAQGEIAAWYWLITDIDDRKRAEEALHSNERNLRSIINTMPTLAWSALPDGSAEFFNQHYLDYVGLPLEKLQGWGWTVAVHPDDLNALSGVWQSIMAAGKPGEAEARFRRSDREYRWFLIRTNPMMNESGEIVKWYGTNTDIDDRKRAEAGLKDSYLRLTEAQRLSKTGSFVTDLVANDHNWSEETFRIFDFDPATKVTVEMIRDIIHPDDLPSFDSVITRGMTGKDVDFSFRIVTSRGMVKHIRGVARVIDQIAGRPLFVGALQDVTETKVAEEDLDRARSELAHVSRVTTLNALTASIAHEINQPLASLLANASSCLRRLNAEPPNVDGARETAQRTIRDANRATDVITRLRALFSKKEFRAETLDLNEVTREVIALSLNDLQRSGVILRSEFAEDLPLVVGDRIQLQQVTLNLLRNASDAMVAVDDRPRQLLIRTQREEEDRVCLNVQDSGCGVNPQDFEKLFQAFYTTKRGGMGIGLSLSRSIIERHRGRLWAEKNDGPGTTFSFSIPCCPDSVKGLSASTKQLSA